MKRLYQISGDSGTDVAAIILCGAIDGVMGGIEQQRLHKGG